MLPGRHIGSFQSPRASGRRDRARSRLLDAAQFGDVWAGDLFLRGVWAAGCRLHGLPSTPRPAPLLPPLRPTLDGADHSHVHGGTMPGARHRGAVLRVDLVDCDSGASWW
jgi:hypothetical protein